MHLCSDVFNLGLGAFVALHRSECYGIERVSSSGRLNQLSVWMGSVTVGVVRAYDSLKMEKMGSKVCL